MYFNQSVLKSSSVQLSCIVICGWIIISQSLFQNGASSPSPQQGKLTLFCSGIDNWNCSAYRQKLSFIGLWLAKENKLAVEERNGTLRAKV